MEQISQTNQKKNDKQNSWAGRFADFCGRNALWVVFCYVLTFAVYGMCLFQNVVTFDAEGLYKASDAVQWYHQWLELGRWMLVVLKKILGVFVINPFFSTAVFFLLFPLSVLLWAFIIDSWAARGNGALCVKHEKVFLYSFSLFYIVQPVWALQFGYRNQMEVIAVAMVLMPLAMACLDGFLSKPQAVPLIVTVLLVTVCFGCYQSFMFVYAVAALIWLILFLAADQKTLRPFWTKVLWLLIITVAAFGLNTVISHAFQSHYGIAGAGHYLTDQFMWGKRPRAENVRVVAVYVKNAVFGDKTTGSAWYAVGFLLCLIGVITDIVKKRKGSILQLLLLVLTALVPFALEMVTAGNIVARSQFAYVLALALFAAFGLCAVCGVLSGWFQKWRWPGGTWVFLCLIILVLVAPTVGKTTRLMYTQVRTLAADYSECQAIYYEALSKGAKENDAVCFVGNKASQTDESMLKFEQMGFSYLETMALDPPGNDSHKAAQAMQAMGLRVSVPTKAQQQKADQLAQTMDTWPNGTNAIVVRDGFFVVKLN